MSAEANFTDNGQNIDVQHLIASETNPPARQYPNHTTNLPNRLQY